MSCRPFKNYTSTFPTLNFTLSLLHRKESAFHREHTETVRWHVKPRPNPQQWFGMRMGKAESPAGEQFIPPPHVLGLHLCTGEGSWVDSPREQFAAWNFWLYEMKARDIALNCFILFLSFFHQFFWAPPKQRCFFFRLWAWTAYNAEGKAHFLKSILGNLTP